MQVFQRFRPSTHHGPGRRRATGRGPLAAVAEMGELVRLAAL